MKELELFSLEKTKRGIKAFKCMQSGFKDDIGLFSVSMKDRTNGLKLQQENLVDYQEELSKYESG